MTTIICDHFGKMVEDYKAYCDQDFITDYVYRYCSQECMEASWEHYDSK